MLNWAIRYTPVVRRLDEMNATDVLDVGSGWFGLSWYRGGRIVQTDLDLSPVPTVRQPIGSATYVRSTVEALPFRPGSFDVVVSLDMMEHLPGRLRRPAIQEMTRVARRAVIVGYPVGRIAKWTDWTYRQFLRVLRRHAPIWLAEHFAQERYPDRNTVLDAVPAGWKVTAERSSGNAIAFLLVLLAEALASKDGMPGVNRNWGWPKALDIGLPYRRIFTLECS